MEKREGVKRVLITSIGGGNTENAEGKMELKKYYDTVYSINNKKYEITTYMPKVVEEEFEVDKTIIIGTTGTMWDNVYRQYCIKNGKEIDEEATKSMKNIRIALDKMGQLSKAVVKCIGVNNMENIYKNVQQFRGLANNMQNEEVA